MSMLKRVCGQSAVKVLPSLTLNGGLPQSARMSVDSIQRHLEEAERARRAGLEDRAREQFEAVLLIDSEEPTARNFLGAYAMRRGDARSAAAHFEIASKREPNESAHWINLASAQRALGNAEAERQALEKILEIDQRDLLALIRLAELHERQGEEADAENRWKAVISLSRSITEPSAEFTQLLNHAKSFVASRLPVAVIFSQTLSFAPVLCFAGGAGFAAAPDAATRRAVQVIRRVRMSFSASGADRDVLSGGLSIKRDSRRTDDGSPTSFLSGGTEKGRPIDVCQPRSARRLASAST